MNKLGTILSVIFLICTSPGKKVCSSYSDQNYTSKTKLSFEIRNNPIHKVLNNQQICLPTNDGSTMLLIIHNTSLSNRAKFYLSSGDLSFSKTLYPNSSDSSSFSLLRDWKGAFIFISNTTIQKQSVALDVMLYGNFQTGENSSSDTLSN